MPFARRLRLRIAWLALAAMLASTLAPGLTHAMQAASEPAGWGEVCRTGSDAADRSDPRPDGHADGVQSCPFCLPHGSSLALPSAQRTFVPQGPQAFALPRLFLLAPGASYPWRAAQPRAPPTGA